MAYLLIFYWSLNADQHWRRIISCSSGYVEIMSYAILSGIVRKVTPRRVPEGDPDALAASRQGALYRAVPVRAANTAGVKFRFMATA